MARERLGGLHSAKLLMWSFDFAQIEAFQHAGDCQSAANDLVEAAINLERCGGQCIVICTNTMHKMATDVNQAVNLPLINIADATVAVIKTTEVIIPDEPERTAVHNIIYDEQCQEIVSDESRQRHIDIVHCSAAYGADSVIFAALKLACWSARRFHLSGF